MKNKNEIIQSIEEIRLRIMEISRTPNNCYKANY